MFSKDFQDRVDHLDAYCRDKGFHAWFETSAKEDIGIDEAIRCLAAKVLIDVVVYMYVSFFNNGTYILYMQWRRKMF